MYELVFVAEMPHDRGELTDNQIELISKMLSPFVEAISKEDSEIRIVDQLLIKAGDFAEIKTAVERVASLESDLAYARKMRMEAEENEGRVRHKLAQYEAYFSRIKTVNESIQDLLMEFPSERR